MRDRATPTLPAALRDVRAGAFGDDELRSDDGRTVGAAVSAAPPLRRSRSAGAIPERSSSSGGLTGSYGFFFWTAK